MLYTALRSALVSLLPVRCSVVLLLCGAWAVSAESARTDTSDQERWFLSYHRAALSASEAQSQADTLAMNVTFYQQQITHLTAQVTALQHEHATSPTAQMTNALTRMTQQLGILEVAGETARGDARRAEAREELEKQARLQAEQRLAVRDDNTAQLRLSVVTLSGERDALRADLSTVTDRANTATQRADGLQARLTTTESSLAATDQRQLLLMIVVAVSAVINMGLVGVVLWRRRRSAPPVDVAPVVAAVPEIALDMPFDRDAEVADPDEYAQNAGDPIIVNAMEITDEHDLVVIEDSDEEHHIHVSQIVTDRLARQGYTAQNSVNK